MDGFSWRGRRWPRVALAAALLAGLAAAGWLQRDLWSALSSATAPDWPWLVVAAGLLAGTYVSAAGALCLVVPAPLPVARTTLVQLAGAVTNRVVPSGLGSAAVNTRYLVRRSVPLSRAVTAVGIVAAAQAVAWAATVVLVLPWAGPALRLPRLSPWTLLTVVAATGALAGAALAGRRSRRLAAAARRVRAQLAELGRHPLRAAAIVAVLVAGKLAHGLALVAVLRAFGSDLPTPMVLLAYLGGSAAAGGAPTPAGLGAAEIALAAALRMVGGGAAVPAAVLLYRAMVWALPVVPGLVAWWLLARGGGAGSRSDAAPVTGSTAVPDCAPAAP